MEVVLIETMEWDYRVVRFPNKYLKTIVPSCNDFYYHIMEILYDDDGSIGSMISHDDLIFPNKHDLLTEVEMISLALRKPIIDENGNIVGSPIAVT